MSLPFCVLSASAQDPTPATPQITIGGNVYGGGDRGEVDGNTNVTIKSVTLGSEPTTGGVVTGGNVYGGGNKGDLSGQTTVTLQGGNIRGSVFGGACEANVGKTTYVNVDGENQVHDLIVNYVYGGNDISGTIGASLDKTDVGTDKVRFTPEVNTGSSTVVNNLFQAYIKTTPEATGMHTYIGQMFGGGNGDYYYNLVNDAGDSKTYNVFRQEPDDPTVVDENDPNYLGQVGSKPELSKTYLQINGGTYGYVYAGGNAVTVQENAVISINNQSTDITHAVTTPTGTLNIADYTRVENLNTTNLASNKVDLRLLSMGINISTFTNDYHFIRVFGGNNKEDSKIRPTWNLQKGSIYNLYSGGNEGRMTHAYGLLLDIAETSEIEVVNVYGGCRKADVYPMNAQGEYQETVGSLSEAGYRFPDNAPARVLVKGGKVTNVYGGNDISGMVWGGSAVGVFTSISGDIYGGGNGSYAYTDNPELKNDIIWGDFYYKADDQFARFNMTPTDASDAQLTSAEALTLYRPTTEAVTVYVKGKDEQHPTQIGGSIYCGGNSASLHHHDRNNDAKSTLQIGSYVMSDQVFMGNNGLHMVDTNILKMYQETVINDKAETKDFSTLTFASSSPQFKAYMEGATMNIKPEVKFASDYVDYSTQFGSFYCGGNRGSMIYSGTNTLDFTPKIIIFDKLVGGCKDANVDATAYNVRYEGGILGSAAEQETAANGKTAFQDENGDKKDRLVLNFNGVKIQPKRWVVKRNSNYEVLYTHSDGTEDTTQGTDGQVSYVLTTGATGDPYAAGYRQLEWNTYDIRTDKDVDVPELTGELEIHSTNPSNAALDEFNRRLRGGNIYGGCYNSGHVNGNVVINLEGSIHEISEIFDEATPIDGSEDILYGHEGYKIHSRHSGVLRDEQAMEVLGHALNVFGGGFGRDAEIWGSTTVNLKKGYTFQIFGGGEEGAVGRKIMEDDGVTPKKDALGRYVYWYDPAYSTYLNLCDVSEKAGVPRGEENWEIAECEFMYGGGFEGPIAGNTHVNLGNGRVFNSFAGSCNADILGHTETYIGRNSNDDSDLGVPWVRDHVYGGNDLGGRILGELRADEVTATGDVENAARAKADCDLSARVKAETLDRVYQYDAGSNPKPAVLTASAYVEYLQGRVGNIFGGCYGDYDYTNDLYNAYTYTTKDNNTNFLGQNKEGFSKPRMGSTFVYFRPLETSNTQSVSRIFGAGQGHTGMKADKSYPDEADFYVRSAHRDSMQNGSYVLIDIPQVADTDGKMKESEEFKSLVVFGAGSNCGLGMGVDPQKAKDNDPMDTKAGESGIEAAAVVDLVRGRITSAFGGSYNEGITRRTIVNVPTESTIYARSIFGGAYGLDNVLPCDVYESNVNYNSPKAWLEDRQDGTNGKADNPIQGVFGGNNNARRTLFSRVNINSRLTVDANNYTGYAYGGGLGENTWAQYTEVNVNDGSNLYKVYGGGCKGKVLNRASLLAWNQQRVSNGDPSMILVLGRGYDPTTDSEDEREKAYGLGNDLAKWSPLALDIDAGLVKEDPDERIIKQKYNTNVYINEGGYVGGYSYGGGFGADAVVCGTTNIELLGGHVAHDIYAAGESGPVYNFFLPNVTETDPNYFVATTNAYVRGGTVRNVYGGGWRGNVGYHDMTTTATTTDVLGQANVIVGNLSANPTYLNGDPAVQRNAYGAGEGGSVYGTSNIIVYNGHVGYNYQAASTTTNGEGNTVTVPASYVEMLDDVAPGDNLLDRSGNVFGGGYVANSYTDRANVTMYGGTVRGSLYGGGEIGPVGRGAVSDAFKTGTPQYVNHDAYIYKKGETHVYLYGGHVLRDVFGGGRGFDNWGGDGTLYYTSTEVSQMDLKAKGFVFGTTEVRIRGGEVGTDDGIALGFGNVFGGGNVGFVYSYDGAKATDDNGYYFNSGNELTEDCKVVVEPYCKVLEAYDGHEVGEYVPIDVLDTYPNSSDNWAKLDPTGVIIHNAVFAGGNVSSGSDQISANTNTVYGNATASVIDIFDKDLITIGDDGIGGLYGDGNLTFVDGYRELNVTNYGTDYTHLSNDLTIADYQKLNERQRAYYELKYKALTTHTYEYYMSKETHAYNGKTYKRGQKLTAAEYAALAADAEEQTKWTTGSTSYTAEQQISENEYDLMDEAEQANWEFRGFCTLYLGRMINTLQRADFCGVFGSRIVLRGARDRVPSEVDYTEYTINRVGELSLNQNTKLGSTHGNYFGIYNIVNYLGALTSDVDFHSTRVTNNDKLAADATANPKSYYDWKLADLKSRTRNDGNSANIVSLASGVWLEVLDESTETAGNKVYGPITGVVELDLVNVATGEGGGYVYAKNEHYETRTDNGPGQTTLSAANNSAISYKQFTYTGSQIAMETSGNFVNSKKRIIDDCYPTSGAYSGANAAPGHYWFIRGDFYVYDQYISAYTGSAQPYAKEVTIPLTIMAEADGKMQLKSIQPNLYAYWDDNSVLPKYKSTTEEGVIIVNNVSYHKNDPISYWTWSQLSAEEQEMFVADETYVCSHTATYGSKTYTEGEVYTSQPSDFGIYVCTQEYEVKEGDNVIRHQAGEVLTGAQYEALDEITKGRYAAVFNRSNIVTHEDGFVLTVDWNNPDVWNDYYHKVGAATTENPATVRSSAYAAGVVPNGYITSPSFQCTESGVYGQVEYGLGDIIDQPTYQSQTDLGTNAPTEGQAKFAVAYVAKENCSFTDNGTTYNYVKGACITADQYNALTAANKAYFDKGKLCTETYLKNNDEQYLYRQVIPEADYNALVAGDAAAANFFSDAYFCEEPGKWGGAYYAAGTNYAALKYTNLSKAERQKFTYNYDALDALVDSEYPAYEDNSYAKVYDGLDKDSSDPATLYAKRQSIDYTATYNGTTTKTLSKSVTVMRNGSPTTTNELQTGDVLTNTVYENDLVNEKAHYAPIVVQATDGSVPENVYVVTEEFEVGGKFYLKGNVISSDDYTKSIGSANQSKVQVIATSTLLNGETLTGNDARRYFYCTEDFTLASTIEGVTGQKGEIISETKYKSLKNEHADMDEHGNQFSCFAIDGMMPSEKSTLYTVREASIDDLSRDKIVTVIYWYEYRESDETGQSYETIREKHIVNIHIHFESGEPTIGPLLPPNTILPGDNLSLNQPTVSKGAFELLGGGWEIFTTEQEANTHQNGAEYVNYSTPLYWYQNEYWVAYYAKSYLGKTYSNPVQISVANYHDIDRVMSEKDNHLYVDHPSLDGVNRRYAKIYIDDEPATDVNKSKLDLLRDFYDLSLHNEKDQATGNAVKVPSGSFKDGTVMTDHTSLNERVRGGDKLDFILRGDVAPKAYATGWDPIGNDTQCFAGTLHGDGYTVSGLDHSLFGTLCGNVYNLGVTGTFTTAGVALKGDGYAENCWVMNTEGTEQAPTTMENGQNPIIGTPTRSDGTQIVNCYYPTSNNYTGTTERGTAVQRPLRAFYDGEVTYDLNGFYLRKRYNDHATGLTQPQTYSYWDSKTLTDGKMTKTDGKYVNGTNDYVEQRYGNIDFTFADGTIPTHDDARLDNTTEQYYPIWPDDYLFFGQTLTYGYDDEREHQSTPSHLTKGSDGRLLTTAANNRVYRAPAYYQSKVMNVAHFNPAAIFANKSKDGTRDAFPGLTAIDYTGYQDVTNGYQSERITTAPYAALAEGKGAFFPPLLDDDGLLSFQNAGVTRNLLVYTSPETGSSSSPRTDNVVAAYLAEPEFAAHYSLATADPTGNYHTVARSSVTVRGHRVAKDNGAWTYTSPLDHLLVDKQDFNAPISYIFAGNTSSGKRMWYQRDPDTFVSLTDGWDGVSLPFTSTLVSTQHKGELTHFYQGSTTGHEYWLRQFDKESNTTQKENNVYTANFSLLAPDGTDRQYTNTFLWDYYYSKFDGKDQNQDIYQRYKDGQDTYQRYYAAAHSFAQYPLAQKGTPYLVGFPGDTYYEFDLSGNFKAEHTASAITQLQKQVITFASEPAITIQVSDDELEAGMITNKDGYNFVPNYMSKAVDTSAGSYFLLNSDGNSYVEEASATAPVPFRPYFSLASGSHPVKGTRSIVFNNLNTDFGSDEEPDQGNAAGEGLLVSAKHGRIIVTSAYDTDVRVTIVTTGGAVVATYDLQPGLTETTQVAPGIYLVNDIKIAVK